MFFNVCILMAFVNQNVIHPYTITWYLEEIFSIFHIFDSIGRTFQLCNRYLLRSDDFFNSIGKNTEKINDSMSLFVLPFNISALGTTTPTSFRTKTWKIYSVKSPHKGTQFKRMTFLSLTHFYLLSTKLVIRSCYWWFKSNFSIC